MLTYLTYFLLSYECQAYSDFRVTLFSAGFLLVLIGIFKHTSSGKGEI